MKSYNGLFERMLDYDTIKKCFLDASKNKRNRKDVAKVLNSLDKNVIKLRKILKNQTFRPLPHDSSYVNEHNCHKIRKIVKPYYKYEQVVHHCIVNQLKPVVMTGFYEFSCGSIPGRGVHYGKKYIEKWIKSYGDDDFYIFKGDIHHYFENISLELLKEKLAKVIRDKKFLELVYVIIDSHKDGLPLGYYTSQWFANFYLKDFDHFVKEELKVEHYMRYMDDLVIMDHDKEKLHMAYERMQMYLIEFLGVELKGNWQIFLFDTGHRTGRILDFMGFKFYRNRTTIRKSIICRARRKVYRTSKKPIEKVNWHDATAILSYLGWFRHTNTYSYYEKYIKTRVEVKVLKKKISNHSRKENRQKNEKLLESCKRNARGSTCRSRHNLKPKCCVPA